MLNTTLELPLGDAAKISEAVASALGKAISAAGVDLPRPRPPERFTREVRDPVYKAMGLTDAQVATIEEIISESPGRTPGKGALDNLTTLIQSQKNGGPRWLESHTVERLLAYQLERNPEVLGYVTQPKIHRVTRKVKKGIHVTTVHLDFLVFYKTKIVLIECKAETQLDKLAEKKDEWRCEGGEWTNSTLRDHAKKLGIEFAVFAVSRLFSVELQNAELINAELNATESESSRLLQSKAASLLRRRPLTIDQVAEELPGFSLLAAARMLGCGDAFGLERVISLADTDQFLLFGSNEHRDIIDEELWRTHLDETAELNITDQLLLAKPKRVALAKKRWNRLEAIAWGVEPDTARMAALRRVVNARIECGLSPIEACISAHDKSGNRVRRLCVRQLEAIDDVVSRWHRGEFSDRDEAWFELGRHCALAEVATPHQSTLNRAIRKGDSSRRTLILDGIRQYQKERPRTDGSRCSLPSIAYGHTLVIDSSNFDQRIAKNLLTFFPSAVPRFYAGIDGATGYPMAHALMFGPARSDGLAILMREYVCRHGFLPRCIQIDRGSENTGAWIKKFAEHFGIELRWTPTGGSRWNGAAENAIGRINHFVAHKGPGSTLPDQFGRAVDGRLKSRKTASRTFWHIVQSFEGYFYGEFAETRDAESLSPHDRREFLKQVGGCGGRPCAFNDGFRVLTSISIDIPKQVARSRGIRLVEGTYAGAALNAALRIEHITELRKDCVDPSVVYAKAGNHWYRAFRRDCARLLIRENAEKLYRLCSEPIWRSERAAHNLELKRQASERRHAEMSEAMTGKENLSPPPPDETPKKDEPAFVYPAIDWAKLREKASA